MITSVSPSKTSQNVYSATSCVKTSDCQTKPNLKGGIITNTFPLERRPIHTPIGRGENTIVSRGGGCRS
jgi:hypothetical protein